MKSVGIIGAILLGLLLLIGLPYIIRDFKRERKKKTDKQNEINNYISILFIHGVAKRQGKLIHDAEVKVCWDMLLQCILTICNGYGNVAGRFDLTNIGELIILIESGIEYESAGIGEDLFYMELLPEDRLAVQLVSQKEECSASLMLKELQTLKTLL